MILSRFWRMIDDFFFWWYFYPDLLLAAVLRNCVVPWTVVVTFVAIEMLLACQAGDPLI